MRVLFRADASTAIGSGHVARCATLAQALAAAGHDVDFACRALAGDLNRWLEAEGFHVRRLAAPAASAMAESEDAAATADAIGGRHYDWLIVDHYGLGATWEQAMAATADRIFVIDDLGRHHRCAALLDQNYRNPAHALYGGRVPPQCELLLGAQFALLRPQFAALRAKSLSRRRDGVSRIVVFMGGGDPANETCKVLDGLSRLAGEQLAIDAVIGEGNAHRSTVESACARLRATLHVQTPRMAELMTAADCAICAAGNITWERCALGLPGLTTILADNQAAGAETVHAAGGQQLLGWYHNLVADDYTRAVLALDPARLNRMSAAAAKICDGRGVERVMQLLSRNGHRTKKSFRAFHA